jgi:hypothetical protein
MLTYKYPQTTNVRQFVLLPYRSYHMTRTSQHTCFLAAPARTESRSGERDVLLASCWKHEDFELLHHAASRAIAQAVGRGLHTAAAWVRVRGRSCGICGRQSGTGAGFLRELRFHLEIFVPPTAPQSSLSIMRDWCNRSISGRRTKWTQVSPHPKKLKKLTKQHRIVLGDVSEASNMKVTESLYVCYRQSPNFGKTLVLCVEPSLSRTESVKARILVQPRIYASKQCFPEQCK